MIKKEENRIRKENGIHTPEKRHNAYDEDSEVVWYDGKVDELGGDEYAPTIGRVS